MRPCRWPVWFTPYSFSHLRDAYPRSQSLLLRSIHSRPPFLPYLCAYAPSRVFMASVVSRLILGEQGSYSLGFVEGGVGVVCIWRPGPSVIRWTSVLSRCEVALFPVSPLWVSIQNSRPGRGSGFVLCTGTAPAYKFINNKKKKTIP